MPVVVPFSAAPQSQGVAPAGPAPDPTFMMMAAAQMHKEGRLVKPQTPVVEEGLRPGKVGVEEWETARQFRDRGEQFDQSNPQGDDIQNLFRNRIRTQVGDKPLGAKI